MPGKQNKKLALSDGKKGLIMNDLEKVKHLIAHWIEHEQEHAADYEAWAGKIQHLEEGAKIAPALREAAQKLRESVECLVKLSPHKEG
jgi:hypothetical protein